METLGQWDLLVDLVQLDVLDEMDFVEKPDLLEALDLQESKDPEAPLDLLDRLGR